MTTASVMRRTAWASVLAVLTTAPLFGEAAMQQIVPIMKPPRIDRVEGRLGDVRGELNWSPSAFACRMEPPAGSRVMFTALGPVTSPAWDSVYDPETDRLFRFEQPLPAPLCFDGERLVLDGPDETNVRVARFEHFVRDVRGIAHHERALDRTNFPRPPSGWCSWYQYYQELSEDDVVRNAEWMARNLLPFGAEYVQIDDAWQGVGHGLGENRDWETIDRRFPHGMKWLADQIRAHGMKPGIWLAPHGQSNFDFVAANRAAFLWRADGSSVGEETEPGSVQKYNWEGRFIVDASGKAGQDYLRRLFRRLADEWGYEYFKIDGQPLVQDLYAKHRDRFADPRLTPEEAYRAGLRVMRETIGPQRFLLGCWGTPWWGAGILDGTRTGGDIDANAGWSGMTPALECTWQNYWTHTIVWYADPDVLCVRPPLTLEQARVWATVMALTGQSLLASDKMHELADERVELLRRVFPPADIRPADLCPLRRPDVICLKIADAAGRRDLVGVFNWCESTRSADLSLDALGLEPGAYVAYDVWRREVLGRIDASLRVTLEPTACRLICIRPLNANGPTLLGTSRHLTQGGVDVESISVADGPISGVSRVVGGDRYEIRVLLASGDDVLTLSAAQAAGAAASCRVEGCVGVVTLESAESRTVRWSATSARAGSTSVAAPQRVRPAGGAGRAAAIEWDASAAAAGYRVYRDGVPLGTTPERAWVDVSADFGRRYQYEVAALSWAGSERKSAPLELRTAPAADVALDELTPLEEEQQWGTPRRGASVSGAALTIAGVSYTRGIGTHARARFVFHLGRGYRRFVARVGVDDDVQAPNAGSVVFQVLSDGELLFDSGVVRSREAAREIDVDVTRRTQLELLVHDAGDGINYDHADWADARLLTR
ncbi:MAG: hypothetical protein CHACPFDD_03698 [Phycisphaerae bacterium]|nr:hypothetical protein [Phycisphaerae bacterium]